MTWTELEFLMTQEGFIQSAMKVACSLELSQETSILPLPLCLLDYINLELHVKILKKQMSPKQLKAIALETMHNRFPTSEWLYIFTDGSLLDVYQGAGAGIFCELFSFYLQLGIFTTAFDGEIKATTVAVEQLSLRSSEFSRVVIFSTLNRNYRLYLKITSVIHKEL
ncbi:uncharacterized protein TNCV_1725151 [Trichonephila clavipes]|nr:uncharacterized protein TNCV_1725151 [Trichonephila clavipes]